MDEARETERSPDPGPFDRILQTEPVERRDRTATYIVSAIVVLAAVLLVLVLPPVSILSSNGEAAVSGPVSAVPRQELPPLPPGFEAVSPLYDLASPDPLSRDVKPVVTVLLHAPQADDRGLALFTYDDGHWRKLAPAVLSDERRAARAELTALPQNVAALRESEERRVVLGSLAPGVELDPRAPEFLTTLNPTGLVPAADGRLAGQPPALPPGLDLPVAPTVAALGPAEIEALNGILSSSDLTAAHVRELVDFARSGSYAGIDLDYRAINPALSGAFTQFVQQLSEALRDEGRTLTLTLPLPVEREERWDTLGYDWRALAPLVDAIKLPLEPNQELYYGLMERVLPFLTAQVGGRKLVLQVTPLSHEQSAEGIRAYTVNEALVLAGVPVVQPAAVVAPGAPVQLIGQNLAQQTGASGIYWEDRSRSVLFSYPGPGGYRTVWIANLFSESFRIDLARRFALGGIAVEDVGAPASGTSDIWPAVQQYLGKGEAGLAKPNDQLLAPHWSADGGSLEQETGPAVTWRAPAEPGDYTVTLIVSDGVVRTAQLVQLSVQPAEAAPP